MSEQDAPASCPLHGRGSMPKEARQRVMRNGAREQRTEPDGRLVVGPDARRLVRCCKDRERAESRLERTKAWSGGDGWRDVVGGRALPRLRVEPRTAKRGRLRASAEAGPAEAKVARQRSVRQEALQQQSEADRGLEARLHQRPEASCTFVHRPRQLTLVLGRLR
jgi:hypothetical protein